MLKPSLDLEKLRSADPKIKYGFTKELLNTASSTPQKLYKHIDALTPLLLDKNNIIKWTGIDLVGYLSEVDTDNKIDDLVDVLFEHLHGGKLITTGHSIFSLGLIAQNKPGFKDDIIVELLKISKDEFETVECLNIAIGKVLDVFKILVHDVRKNKAVIDFIKIATDNSRNATKKRAMLLLKRIEKLNK